MKKEDKIMIDPRKLTDKEKVKFISDWSSDLAIEKEEGYAVLNEMISKEKENYRILSEENQNLKQLLNTLENKNKNTKIKLDVPIRIGNAGIPGSLSENTKVTLKQNIKHIFETFTLKANHEPDHGHCLELTSLSGAFLPRSMQIIVRNIKTREDSFIEICNVTVMGDPQLINFNGRTDRSQRGTSLVFKEQQNFIDWAVFGSSAGQGLSFNFANPNSFDVEVTIILVGLDSGIEMVGQR